MESAKRQNFRGLARRGLTFVETICAVAMLALVAVAVMGAFNSIIAQQLRERHRLGAMELANRLILQYLDDSDTMPAAGLPIVYGDERYHWDLHEVPVQLIPARPDVADDRTTASAISVNRMHAINVTVWLSDESGGSAVFDARVPSATLTRLMDPIALRNPDTTKALAQNPVKQREFLERFRTVGRNAPGPKPGATSGDSKPATSPGAKPTSPSSNPVKPTVKPSRSGPFQPGVAGSGNPNTGVNPKAAPPSRPPPKGPKS